MRLSAARAPNVAAVIPAANRRSASAEVAMAAVPKASARKDTPMSTNSEPHTKYRTPTSSTCLRMSGLSLRRRVERTTRARIFPSHVRLRSPCRLLLLILASCSPALAQQSLPALEVAPLRLSFRGDDRAERLPAQRVEIRKFGRRRPGLARGCRRAVGRRRSHPRPGPRNASHRHRRAGRAARAPLCARDHRRAARDRVSANGCRGGRHQEHADRQGPRRWP